MVGYLGHRQAVEISQRQRRALWPRQPRQRRVCGAGIEQLLPWIVGLVRSDGRKPPPLTLAAAPVIDELVSCDADQPCDTHGGGSGVSVPRPRPRTSQRSGPQHRQRCRSAGAGSRKPGGGLCGTSIRRYLIIARAEPNPNIAGKTNSTRAHARPAIKSLRPPRPRGDQWPLPSSSIAKAPHWISTTRRWRRWADARGRGTPGTLFHWLPRPTTGSGSPMLADARGVREVRSGTDRPGDHGGRVPGATGDHVPRCPQL